MISKSVFRKSRQFDRMAIMNRAFLFSEVK
jgi:hypothetical protein